MKKGGFEMEGFALFIMLVGAAAMSGAVMQVVDYFEHPKKSAKKDRFCTANTKAVSHR